LATSLDVRIERITLISKMSAMDIDNLPLNADIFMDSPYCKNYASSSWTCGQS